MTRNWTEERYRAAQAHIDASVMGMAKPGLKSPQKARSKPARPATGHSRPHKFPGLPECLAEYRFAAPRKFRFDYCWVPEMLALEVEGGAWLPGGGRHNRPAGFLKDIEKYNIAAVLGFRVLRCTPGQLRDGSIFPTILAALL